MSYESSASQTIHMKCQALFSKIQKKKTKKKTEIKMSSDIILNLNVKTALVIY